MLGLLLALILATADAGCCRTRLTYGVTTPGLTYQFQNNYAELDVMSQGTNTSIAVIAGCPVDFVLSTTGHPFLIEVASDGSQVTNFTQAQTSGTVTWMVPNDTSTVFKYQCQVHPVMTNTIRVLPDCDSWDTQQCTDYCNNITATCTGSLVQFPDPSSDIYDLCMNACKTYPGNSSLATVTGGDSVQCRIYHVGLAAVSPANAIIHCNHSGFNGGPGVCGEFCEAYCDNIMAACNDPASTLVFADRATCMQECSYYPRNWNFDLSSDNIPTDNSIECRSWHSQVASNAGKAAVHCPHAAPAGGGACGDPCDNYCDNIMAACVDTLVQWNSWADCYSACKGFPNPNYYNVPANSLANFPFANNSLPCRKYHAFLSGQSASYATTHCIHAGPLGGSGVCGSECEGLCNMVVASCHAYVDFPTCLTACTSNLTQSGSASTQDILMAKVPKKSVGCATYYAIKALTNATVCDMLIDGSFYAGPACQSGAAFLQASWAVLAIILLALGFTSY